MDVCTLISLLKDSQLGVDVLRYLNEAILQEQDELMRRADKEHDLRVTGRMKSQEYDSSVRYISGDRVEIKLNAGGGGSTTFDTVLAPHVVRKLQSAKSMYVNTSKADAALMVKDFVMKLVTEQAKAANNGRWSDYKFGTYSIIVSFGQSEAQAIHIDMVAPLVQFAFMLSDSAESTQWYEPNSKDIIPIPKGVTANLECLRAALQQMAETSPLSRDKSSAMKGLDELMAAIQEATETEPELARIFFGYSKLVEVADTNKILETEMKSCRLERGSGTGMLGSVPHCAPATEANSQVAVRAVLFFSGAPRDENLYDEEVQYTPTQYMWTMISELMYQGLLTTNESHGRLYALQRLADCAFKAQYKDTLINFMEARDINEYLLRELVRQVVALKDDASCADFCFVKQMADNWQKLWPCQDSDPEMKLNIKHLDSLLKSKSISSLKNDDRIRLLSRGPGRPKKEEKVHLWCNLCKQNIGGPKIPVPPATRGFFALCVGVSKSKTRFIDYTLASDECWEKLQTTNPQTHKRIVSSMRKHLQASSSCNVKCGHPRLVQGGSHPSLPGSEMLAKEIEALLESPISEKHSIYVCGNGGPLRTFVNPKPSRSGGYTVERRELMESFRCLKGKHYTREQQAEFWLKVYNAKVNQLNSSNTKCNFSRLKRDPIHGHLKMVEATLTDSA